MPNEHGDSTDVIWYFLYYGGINEFNSLNTELNPTCHFLELLGAHPIPHSSRISVKGSSFPGVSHVESRDLKHNGFLLFRFCLSVGRDSSVGIATRYGLNGQGIESWWGRDFPHASRPVLGPTQPPIQWLPGLSRGVKRPGRDVDHPPPSSAEVKEKVELYLYSPSGSSWPVLG